MRADTSTGRHWSILTETACSARKVIAKDDLVPNIREGLRRCGIVPWDAQEVTTFTHSLPFGYPVPFVGRDQVLSTIEPALRECGIYSRGRFGGWKYEVSNQDHSFMQGVEAVENIIHGVAEVTYRTPESVNM